MSGILESGGRKGCVVGCAEWIVDVAKVGNIATRSYFIGLIMMSGENSEQQTPTE